MIRILIGALMLLAMTACQTVPYQGQARDVKRKPLEEGVISIPLNYREEDRAKAEVKMKTNCQPGAYKVLEEGEVAVGEETKSSSKETDRASTERSVGKIFGVDLMSGEAAGKNKEATHVTTQIKEWHISYKCMADRADKKSSKVR